MARRKKDELTQQLDAAKQTGRYMVAVWSVQDGKLNLFRVTNDFPIGDLAPAVALLEEDLKPMTIRHV